MTWTTIITIWFIFGAFTAVWTLISEAYVYRTLEYNIVQIFFMNFFVIVLAFVLGPIAFAIKFYEDFIDTV